MQKVIAILGSGTIGHVGHGSTCMGSALRKALENHARETVVLTDVSKNDIFIPPKTRQQRRAESRKNK